jgi:FAD/FMN-containing dehydrogenase
MSVADVIQTLQSQLDEGGIIVGPGVAHGHSVDFSGEHACPPAAVVRPRSTAELSFVVRTCAAHRQPIVIQGGMTGLAGGATPQHGEIALSLERMNGIEEIDALGATATVLAGTPLQTVHEAVGEAGFLFPLDLGARGSCTIGGNVATNAGGNQVIRFGMMRNLVLGLEAVLADGTIVSSMNKMLKNNAGYDLKQLFIGTEGTLGIVTRAVLRLHPLQPAKTTAICAVPTFDAMLELLQLLRSSIGGSLSAFEAMWASYFDYVVENVHGLRSPFEADHPIYVLVETEGSSAEAESERMENALEKALTNGMIVDAAFAQSEQERKAFWQIRDGIGDITPMLQPMLAFDVSVPVAQMKPFLEEIDRRLKAEYAHVRILLFGHIGDNNLHIAVTTGRAEDFKTLCDIVYGTTGTHDGSVSAEHGVGVLRRHYVHLSRGHEELELMRKLKRALDPHGILNPGRVVPDPN